jgi:hypothetical protein
MLRPIASHAPSGVRHISETNPESSVSYGKKRNRWREAMTQELPRREGFGRSPAAKVPKGWCVTCHRLTPPVIVTA